MKGLTNFTLGRKACSHPNILAYIELISIVVIFTSYSSVRADFTILADSVTEFSATQGQDNWYYGYYEGGNSGDFRLLPKHAVDQEGIIWYIDGYWTGLHYYGGHPNGRITSGGRQPVEHWVVRRWISELTGLITVKGRVAKHDPRGGDGVTCYILIDGQIIWSQYVAYNDGEGIEYSLDITVNSGSALEFAIAPNANDWNDDSIFTAEIRWSEPPWSFVQMTDLHIGYSGADERLANALDQINSLYALWYPDNPKPDFILVTGDVADYGCDKNSQCSGPYQTYLATIKKHAIEKGISVYTVPGNHDRIKPEWYQCWKLLYCNECDSGLTCYFKGKDPVSQAAESVRCGDLCWFGHKGFYFIGLDTGPGNVWGDGLSDGQLTALTNSTPSTQPNVPKIIFMHHPYVDVAIPSRTFKNNRKGFIEYSTDNSVQLVLAGHTHEDHILDKDGNPLLVGSTTYPQFIQTVDLGKSPITESASIYPAGFRIVEIKGNNAYPKECTSINENRSKVAESIYSAGNIHIYDSSGRHTGVTIFGEEECNIPHSFHFSHYVVATEDGNEIFPEKIIIFDPCDNYLSRVVGTETGPYRLVISSVKDGNEVVFEANDVPALQDAVHEYKVDWQALSKDPNDQNAVTIMVDEDGDGNPEKTIISDGKLTGDEFVSEWPKLDDYVTIQVGEAGYDHQKKRLGVNVTVTNTSEKTLGIPLWVVVESVSEPNVTLADANGVSSKDKNYADLSELLLNDPNRKLDPGESITKRIYFNNPDEVRFTFKPSVRGVILSQGEGTGFGNLSKMSQHWLGDEPALDVAPLGGDGIINLRDFAVLAERWLDF